jgi:hypothetical protein
MRDGIEIPAPVVRAVVVIFALALLALLVREAPEMRRYLKIETM